MKCAVALLLLSGACAVLGLSTELKDPLPDECRGGGNGNAIKLDGGDCERGMDGICYNPTCRNCVDGNVLDAAHGFCGGKRRACCALQPRPPPANECEDRGGICMDGANCRLSVDGWQKKRGWCPGEAGTNIICCLMDRQCRDKSGECLRVVTDKDKCKNRGHKFQGPNAGLCGGEPWVQCCKR